MRYVEKTILLQTLDHLWREHLIMLDHLRQVIGLRGYGQRDPLQEYKSEAFALYEAMTAHLREAVTAQLMRVEIVPPEEQQPALPVMEAHSSIRTPARTRWRLPMRRWCRRPPPTAIRRIPRPGARSGATRIVPAAQARSTSTATASMRELPAH